MWTLRSYKPYKNFPSVTYFWIDSDGIVRHQRDVSLIGFLPVTMESLIGKSYKSVIGLRKVKTKATQEQLQKGILVL